MTQLFGFALLAVGGYLVVNKLKKKMAEVERTLSQAARNDPNALLAESLVLDPETGKYRPKG